MHSDDVVAVMRTAAAVMKVVVGKAAPSVATGEYDTMGADS